MVFAEGGRTDPRRSTSGTSRPWFKMSMAVRRKPAYILTSVLLPVQLLCLLCLGSFCLPNTELADRLSVSLTMVLTTVAYRSQVIYDRHSAPVMLLTPHHPPYLPCISQAAADLPKISHLTLVDVQILTSLAFTALVAFANLASYQLGSERFDRLCAATMVALHVAGWLLLVLGGWAAHMHGLEAIAKHESGGRIRVDSGDEEASPTRVLRRSLTHVGVSVGHAARRELARQRTRASCSLGAAFGVGKPKR